MDPESIRRRDFLSRTAAGSLGLALSGTPALKAAAEPAKPAVLGGPPVRSEPFPSWPVIADVDETNWRDVLHARGWCRLNGSYAERFEKEYASLLGAKDCLATMNGTSALLASLAALDIGPGDEVLVPPYTFVATINVVLLVHGLPVFVDTDPSTFQIDARKIEARITDRTRCIIPVHLGGNPADLDTVMAVGKKHDLAVLEDACQAHLAEWRGRKVGTIGDAGCFSFQVTKNLCSGEGGAVVSDNIELMDRAFAFHGNGRERTQKSGFGYVRNGANLRMTEFQAALLLGGMTRLEEQSRIREQNAARLTAMLEAIPGITPARMYEGTTRNAYHLYMFHYDADAFAGLPRDGFLRALQAEGVPCMGGYSPLNKHSFIEAALRSRGYRAIYSAERIDRYFAENECPANDKLCQEAVWFTQTMLLGPGSDMDQIAEAIAKIRAHAGAITKKA